jgi:hypothetical protein
MNDFTSVSNKWQFLALLVTVLVLHVPGWIGQAVAYLDNRKRMQAADAKIDQVGHAVNGQSAALAAASFAAGEAKGLAAGIAAERAVAAQLQRDQTAAAVTALAVTVAAAKIEADSPAQTAIVGPVTVRSEGEGAGHP